MRAASHRVSSDSFFDEMKRSATQRERTVRLAGDSSHGGPESPLLSGAADIERTAWAVLGRRVARSAREHREQNE